MKTKLIIGLVLLLLPACKILAQPSVGANIAAQQQRQMQQQIAAYQQQQYQNAVQSQILAAQQQEKALIYSKDLWRNIDGATNLARGDGWVEFQGQVQEALPGGTIFKGCWGQILSIHTEHDYAAHQVSSFTSKDSTQMSVRNKNENYNSASDSSIVHPKIYGEDLFYVEGFPYPSESGRGYEQMMVMFSGYYSYTNSMRQVITVQKLIYGLPCIKKWSADEIAAAQKSGTAKKQALAGKILKYNQDLANQGDAYGLLRMGERYRDGDDVEKNLIKAMMYFSKAADAGSVAAKNELDKLAGLQK